MFELGLPGRTDGDRDRAISAAIRATSTRLGQCAGLLRWLCRQRPMRAAEAARLPARWTRDRAMPCRSGYIKAGGSCCLASNVTSTGVCCPPGQAPGLPSKKACVPILRIPIGHLCCAAGHIPTASGACCAPANVTTTGVCCSQPVDPSNRAACPGANPEPSGVRCRLRQDAGRQLLQPALRQRRRTFMPRRPAALRSGRVPQCAGERASAPPRRRSSFPRRSSRRPPVRPAKR